jgi:phytoene dehydrogenase-like protein
LLDAVVVGSGPNGLAAALVLATAGRSVLVLEAAEQPGGGLRSAELTLPGFTHDVCSGIHPLAFASPYLRTLPLERHGLEWVHPPAALAHPFDDGSAVVLDSSIETTAATLGPDAEAWRRLFAPLVRGADALLEDILGPLRVPHAPLALLALAPRALLPAATLARRSFVGERARALLAGIAAHSTLPLSVSPSGAFGLVLGLLGHAVGWPFPRGGAQRLTGALVAHLRSLGGELETGAVVRSLAELPRARAVLLDVAPRGLLALASERLPPAYRRQLGRFRHGPGVAKVDFALDRPIPWTAPACARAATVHLGGTLEEIAASEAAPGRGRPFVLLAQHSLFDDTRAPGGLHTAWAYCHVPNGSTADFTASIETQIERFAPGFRNRILARSARAPADLERENANYVGGDIAGGRPDLRQLWTRPAIRLNPYRTPLRGVYLCSSSTPPGPGVHGMCGYWAARTALKDLH